jgi:anti-anti-sigma factor
MSDSSDKVKIYRVTGPTVVQDEEVEAFKSEVGQLIDDDPAVHLALDFSSTFQVSSRALGLLVAFRKRLKAQGGRIVLFGINPAIGKVMEVTRLNTIIPTARDESKALEVLKRYPISARPEGYES